jgi:hypothetical protein
MFMQRLWFKEHRMPLLKTLAGALVGEAVGRKRGNGLLGAGLGIIATRIATRSLPGAVIVGGALVAKKLYDRRKARKSPAAKDVIIDQ